MKITDIKLEKLLPLFMQQQKDDVTIAQHLNPIIRETGEKIKLCSEWGHISELPEEFIDALAWELDVDWYYPKADLGIDVKRELVANADEVHKELGTKAAVKRVVEDIFGNGTVTEWFEFEGTPGTFKVQTREPLTNDNIARFMKTIGQVKNTRSHLIEVTCLIVINLDDEDVVLEDIIQQYGDIDIYTILKLTYTLDWRDLEQIDLSGVHIKLALPFFYTRHLDGSFYLDGECDLTGGQRIGESVAVASRFALETEESVPLITLTKKGTGAWFLDGSVTLNGAKNLDTYYKKEVIV